MVREYTRVTEVRRESAPTTSASIATYIMGLKPREPRLYDGDRSNGKLDDYIRDVTTWIDFYARRGQWTSE